MIWCEMVLCFVCVCGTVLVVILCKGVFQILCTKMFVNYMSRVLEFCFEICFFLIKLGNCYSAVFETLALRWSFEIGLRGHFDTRNGDLEIPQVVELITFSYYVKYIQ